MTRYESLKACIADAPATAPQWLRDQRLQDAELFDATPMPHHRMEHWRRTDLSGVSLEAFLQPLAAVSGEVRSLDGRLEFVDGRLHGAPDPSSCAGVHLGPLSAMVEHHGDILRPVMVRPLADADVKFTSLARSGCAEGAALIIDRDVQMDGPLHIRWTQHDTAALATRTVVVVRSGARALLIEEHLGLTSAHTVTTGLTDIVLEPGADLTVVSLIHHGDEGRAFHHQYARVGCDAHLTSINLALGGKLTKGYVAAELAETGARSDLLGVTYATSGRHIDMHTVQHHTAPHTESDLLFKAALEQDAACAYSGLIRIEPGAQQTAAYQRSETLLLSPEARAVSLPYLEIEADDVRCTHGATVAPVDPEMVYYAAARGIPQDQATRLIVQGFLQPVLDRMGDPAIIARVDDEIRRQMDLGADHGPMV